MTGTAYFCIGEEATGIGVCSASDNEDYILQTHRGHNQGIGKNMDINRLSMAEFLGKENGYCRGRGGCMHIADFSKAVWAPTVLSAAESPLPSVRH